MDLMLPAWHRRAGLFFQYFSRQIEDRWEHRFQSVELEQDRRIPFDRLIWSGWEIIEHSGTTPPRYATRKLWADTEIPRAHDRGPCPLEIRVGSSGFPAVSWRGRDWPADRWSVRFAGQRQAAITSDRWHRSSWDIVGLITGDRDEGAGDAEVTVVALSSTGHDCYTFRRFHTGG